jgi:hypothetical protein
MPVDVLEVALATGRGEMEEFASIKRDLLPSAIGLILAANR